ncbi:PREDICTED: probable methyltransferase-like protein 15 isoform X2 [Gavialis gangeticus]|uniref:probable methyltransferase-like protein 15 isoform X2 n=1 Tax=Gavialis gangeticus TaxID=94835 RepID=UPI00092FA35A|nr:PREDICTED: probable methyltransferase-like protein 15 isoform X2 [Gavialis gangeticus]
MLLPRYLCHGYKRLFLCSLQSGLINKCVWARNAESSTDGPNGPTDQTTNKNEVHANINESAEDEDYKNLHIPVMVKEVIDCLSPQPGQCFLDMTFGAGGHTVAILQKARDIKIYALDRDPAAYQIAQQLSDSYPYPDMPTAADVVNALDQQALTSILRAYGEERHARKIASAIVQARSIYPITRTQQFASIVAGAFPAAALYARKDLLQRPTHVATKTFQALRIFVNDELHELYTGLRTVEKFLKPGGVLVALSFHSLEDRIIKRFLYGIDISEKPNLSIQQKIRLEKKNRFKPENNEEFSNRTSNSKWTSMKKKVITPQAMDIKENPRARSAKLRAATKL